MDNSLTVVLLDGERFAPQLAATLKTPVWAVTADTITAQVNDASFPDAATLEGVLAYVLD
jgi:hypothetical protein